MDKKIFRVISINSFLCLLLSIYGIYYAVSIFGMPTIKLALESQVTYLVIFSLIFVMSLLRKIYIIFFIILLGVIWSYFYDAVWVGQWLYIAISKQLLFPYNLPMFLSGVNALLFMIIILLTLYKIVKSFILS